MDMFRKHAQPTLKKRAASQRVRKRTGVVVGAAISLALLAGRGVAAAPQVFQIRFQGGGEVLAEGRPFDNGTRMVFRRHPDGALMSVKKSDVVGITAAEVRPATRSLRPGEQLDVGLTEEGTPRLEPKNGLPQRPPPASAPEMFTRRGTRWIPGFNAPFPPAPAVQRGPGEPPTGIQQPK